MVENTKIFAVNKSEQLRVEKEIDDAVDPARLNFISIDDLANENLPNFINLLTCDICKGLAHNPVQDKFCEQCLCRFCLENALNSTKKCPVSHCSDQFESAERIHKVY